MKQEPFKRQQQAVYTVAVTATEQQQQQRKREYERSKVQGFFLFSPFTKAIMVHLFNGGADDKYGEMRKRGKMNSSQVKMNDSPETAEVFFLFFFVCVWARVLPTRCVARREKQPDAYRPTAKKQIREKQ